MFSSRLHYPIEVTKLYSGFEKPSSVAFSNGALYIAVLGGKSGPCIKYIDNNRCLTVNVNKTNRAQLEEFANA